MSLFDIFGTGDQQQAAQDQINALKAGQAQGTADLNTGVNNLKTSYAAGLSPLLQNYSAITPGVTQLGNLMGLNGADGSATAQKTLEGMPGYQFTLNQGTQNVQRTNAAQGYGGGGSSGNVDKAIADYTSGLAGQNYNNYVSQLQPYLTGAQNTGGQIASTNANLGNQQLGAATTQANMDYGTNVGIGNANASADLAGLNASANGVNALMNGGKLAASIFGMLSGAIMAAWDNPVAAPNYGAAPTVDFSQLANLARPQQQQQQQQGQPLNLAPQLPLAQRLAALLGSFGQQGNQGTVGGTGGNIGGLY